jgi:nitrile hydratase subunit beta
MTVSRVNDVGGQQGFGAIDREAGDEPAFHADWEARVFTLNRVLLRRGVYNLDEFRDAIERMPPEEYLRASYYERWLTAIETLLAEKGVLARE